MRATAPDGTRQPAPQPLGDCYVSIRVAGAGLDVVDLRRRRGGASGGSARHQVRGAHGHGHQDRALGLRGPGLIEPDLLKHGGVVALTTKDANDFLDPGEASGARLNGGFQDVNDERLGSLAAYGRGLHPRTLRAHYQALFAIQGLRVREPADRLHGGPRTPLSRHSEDLGHQPHLRPRDLPACGRGRVGDRRGVWALANDGPGDSASGRGRDSSGLEHEPLTLGTLGWPPGWGRSRFPLSRRRPGV
jgi:hypothetical protein